MSEDTVIVDPSEKLFAPAAIPSSLVPSAATSLPSTVPATVTLPVEPFTLNLAPLEPT